jgi:hypothetical protein
MRKILTIVLLIIFTFSICIAILPWWSNKYSCILQDYIGWSPWYLPNKYTGVVKRYYHNFTLQSEVSMKDGKYHGYWREFSNDGKLKIEGEWKNGLPWNGLCHFWPEKIWLAEYKNGAIYNGAMIDDEKSKDGQVIIYYLNGKIVNKDEYCDANNIPRTSDCFGIFRY